MEITETSNDTLWHKEIEAVQQEIYTVNSEIGSAIKDIRRYVTLSSRGTFDCTGLTNLLVQICDSHGELWNLYTEYDPKLAEAYEEDILANLKKKALALNKILKRLHSILASLVSRRTATPVTTSKVFIKDNKLPAPADEEIKRERLPISIAEDLANTLDLTDKEMATILTISIRTYHRLKLNGLLNPVASERLLLLKELAVYGLEVFENQGNFNQWLRLPLRDLSNTSPLNSLDTATGFNRVKTILARIEYGVYS